MRNIGFTIIGGKTSWMGGVNYLKNLLYAIDQIENKEFQPILFVGKKIDPKLLSEFKNLAIIKSDAVFDRFSVKWFVDVLMRDIFKLNPIINRIVKKHDIEIFSHSYIYGKDLRCKIVNWIPDFQHIRLPQMFSKLHYLVRNFRLMDLIKYSDVVILSSYDAYNDYEKIAPKYIYKAKVIHFVSQVTTYEQKPKDYLESKYDFKGDYFYLPNQFWVHKNHQVAFEAIKIAKVSDPSILLLCSGHLIDSRNKKYIESLISFIKKNDLSNNIKLLGLIPFNDVLLLMQYSEAIINPSFFEGWSSTVEEAKSMGKKLFLSDILVHKEQAPSNGVFFDPKSPEQLADKLIADQHLNMETFEKLLTNDSFNIRILNFANEYISTLKEIF